MILDSLKNGFLYYGINPRLQRAFEYLATTDLRALELGRHEIDGDAIFINVMELDLKRPEDAPIEVHNKYIDIQVLVVGTAEEMGWSERRNCSKPCGPFDEQKDVQFYADRPQNFVSVKPGQFAIFLPEDAHAPMVGQGHIKKVIVKVLK